MIRPPLAVIALHGWKYELIAEIDELAADPSHSFPTDPQELDSNQWRRMLTRYRVRTSAPGAIGFRAPAAGSLSMVSRDDRLLLIFMPWNMAAWRVSTGGTPRPHGNALILHWEGMPSMADARDNVLRNVLYLRVEQSDPVQILVRDDEGTMSLERTFSDTEMMRIRSSLDLADTATAAGMVNGKLPRIGKQLLPVRQGDLLPLPGAHETVELGFAHVPVEAGRVAADKPWTWLDIDALLLRLVFDEHAFQPVLALPETHRTDLRAWHELDLPLAPGRIRNVRARNLTLYNPPESVRTGPSGLEILQAAVPSDIAALREAPVQFRALSGTTRWERSLLSPDHDVVLSGPVVLSTGESLLVRAEDDRAHGSDATDLLVTARITESSLAVHGAALANCPPAIRRVWMFGQIPTFSPAAGAAAWLARYRDLLLTDVVLVCNVDAHPRFRLDTSRDRIVDFAAQLTAAGISPHLMTWIRPDEDYIKECADVMYSLCDETNAASLVIDGEHMWRRTEATPPPLTHARLIEDVLAPRFRVFRERSRPILLTATDNLNVAQSNDKARYRALADACDQIMPQSFSTHGAYVAEGNNAVRVPGATQRRAYELHRVFGKPMIMIMNSYELTGFPGLTPEAAIGQMVSAVEAFRDPAITQVAFWAMLNLFSDPMTTTLQDEIRSLCTRARGAALP